MTARSMRLRPLLAVLCAVALAVTGCANVPMETRPQAIGEDEGGRDGDDEPAGPELNLSAADVVREFVQTNGSPAGDYETSRHYLQSNVRTSWQPTGEVQIIDDTFDTVPVSADEQPDDPNETIIRLRGTTIGSLRADGSFLPGKGPYESTMRLRKQPDEQWRIVDVPADVVTTESEFSSGYKPVTLYFFAPDSDVTVPDQRYLAAEPASGLAKRVVDALLEGPSDALAKAVDDPLEDASLDTNVTDTDGALRVPLTGLDGTDAATRKRIVTQVVLSLRLVSASSTIRPLSDEKPILEDRRDWRPSDLDTTSVTPGDSSGMAVADDRLVSLEDGSPIAGPAGAGSYALESAAQSLEGEQLAVVENYGSRQRLRVGMQGDEPVETDVTGSELTRPTWRPAYPGNEVSNEVWTVADGDKVLRASLNAEDEWTEQTVNTSALDGFGEITALRLSHDGTRAALIADDELVVASVSRSQRSVRLTAPTILQPDTLSDVVDVDWLEQDSLVVATETAGLPVVEIGVDGFRMDKFNIANLETPVNAIAAAPDGSVVADNNSGLWTASGLGEVWRQHPVSDRSLASPFYPG